jgi:CMP-N-acetylneuraminic acid synthetase
MLLQPTSPFRSAADIDGALRLQKETNADAVISLAVNERPVQWLRRIDQHGMLAELSAAEPIQRRQDADPTYRLNGAIYLVKTDVFMRERSWYPKRARAYVMPPESSLEIDTELDFLIADLVMRHRQQGKPESRV